MSHLKDVKENYFTHLFEALLIVLSLIVATVTCFIHSIFPFLFKKTASSIIRKILQRTDERYDR